jgi:hypothetical protein
MQGVKVVVYSNVHIPVSREAIFAKTVKRRFEGSNNILENVCCDLIIANHVVYQCDYEI